jgi:proteasome lid subunit RPN8/RPN11
VSFDGLATLQREERHGDVVGFLHTHPDGLPQPSERDVRTMRAWCSALGKALLCVIESPAGLAAWRFDDDESTGTRTSLVEVFPRGIVIGVDADGGTIPS